MSIHSQRVYLDYNASTPLDPRVAAEFAKAMAAFGNPSSIHAEGREARGLIDEARISIGRLLNCDHRQILFTSGGTESNNLAILGAARANRSKGNHVITSGIEHSSVLNACRQLESEGFELTYLPPDPNGMIPAQRVQEAIREHTILITLMMANNEVGTIQPVTDIAAIAKTKGILFHVDAIQAVGKIPVDVQQLQADFVSLSSHKIYGPKGVGALYVSSDINLRPLIYGGSHEKGFRAGTENVPGIHAFGYAGKLLMEEGSGNLIELHDRLEGGLSRLPVTILCKDAPRLPNTVNFYAESWLGESLVMAFDLEGIAVSNGSACSAGIIEPSHVILALGYNESVARSVIRVSFGRFTQVKDVDYFLQVVQHLSEGRTS